MQNRWAPRGASFVLWALVAGSAAFWGLKFSARSSASVSAMAASGAAAAADPAAVARLLGAGPATAMAAAPMVNPYSRFALVGVVAGASHNGAALIAIDGKPAKPFRVGSKVDEGLVLQSVAARKAVLAGSADGPAVATLELPLPKR